LGLNAKNRDLKRLFVHHCTSTFRSANTSVLDPAVATIRLPTTFRSSPSLVGVANMAPANAVLSRPILCEVVHLPASQFPETSADSGT
jgi:hypothetical protein